MLMFQTIFTRIEILEIRSTILYIRQITIKVFAYYMSIKQIIYSVVKIVFLKKYSFGSKVLIEYNRRLP